MKVLQVPAELKSWYASQIFAAVELTVWRPSGLRYRAVSQAPEHCFAEPTPSIFRVKHKASKLNKRRGSAVCVATGYGLDGRQYGVRFQVETRIFASPYRPDRLLSLPVLTNNVYRGLFPGG
jgi:hypothetical protein